MKVRDATGGAVVAIAVLTACGSQPEARTHDSLLPIRTPQSVRIGAADIDGLGTVLVDSSGHTLYMFPPDARTRVSCMGACAGTWPPVTIRDGQRPTAVGGVVASRLATLPDPNSGQDVVTYQGYPLYRYAGDVTAGTANGQAIFNDGGPWYAIAPSGVPVTAVPRAAR